MKLVVRNSYFKALAKAGGTKIDDWTYRQDDSFGTIDTTRLTDADLGLLKDIAKKGVEAKESGAAGLYRRICAWEKIHESVDTAKISDLNAMVEAVRVFFKDAPNKWAFMEEADGEMIPFYVVGATFEEAEPEHLKPAKTTIELESMCRGKKESHDLTFHRDDLGKTMSDLLEGKDVYREAPDMVTAFIKESERYRAICSLTGDQFFARNRGYAGDSYYDNSLTEMEMDGELSKVVMDDYGDPENDDEENSRRRRGGSVRRSEEAVVDAKFWRKEQRKHKHDEEDSETDIAVLPTQPYVQVFDLRKHRHVVIHVNNLENYQYDETVVDKLILPKPDKDLIHILVQGADAQMEDIVKGKTGGIIVISTGPPGTGKTLTAEVFSECVKRPLYSVQCSQLGTSPERLEKKLMLTLNRAVRWKAILLIDEADVYIHERGADIDQNAIVGVWLRILEHYKGIMFMTSNRATIIDDAIVSRETAHIRYDYPEPKALKSIWQVLSKQYRVTLSLETVEKLVQSKSLGRISGRAVKNLLKLARLLSLRKKEPVTLDMIEYVSQYLDLEREENHARDTDTGRQDAAGGGLSAMPGPRARTREARMAGTLATEEG